MESPNIPKHKTLRQMAGQTLIETLAALFILTMGISAAVGLAVYAFNSSTSITKAIIATGLAREGLEALRNMRDTNWLQDTLVINGCYDFNSNPVGLQTANCYQNWLGKNNSTPPPFCFDPSSGGSCNGTGSTGNYYLGFDKTNTDFWFINKDNSKFGLNFDATNSGNSGFYFPSNSTCKSSNSGFCREIVITKTSNVAPYDKDSNLTLITVQVKVWWTDKKCPAVDTYPGAGKCSVELDTYLTNWKNY